MKKALITGISGQDGSYLAELLVSKGYKVHGSILPLEYSNPQKYLWRLSSVLDEIVIHPVNITDQTGITTLIKSVQPDECYHLAASSFVSYSFEAEFSVFDCNLNGTHYILGSLKETAPECRFFFAGSSEMFGEANECPQDEKTPFNPRSPYGITKAASFFLTRYYRDYHKLFTCNGISYNHESVRRGREYVTRKITSAAAAIKLGLQNEITLGNLDAKRDWGYAQDYVRAMWLMLQMEVPDDYVLATGELHSVRDICDIAFSHLGLDYHDYVKIDEEYIRPESKIALQGNPEKAKKTLGWQPEVTFEDMIIEMVEFDLANLSND